MLRTCRQLVSMLEGPIDLRRLQPVLAAVRWPLCEADSWTRQWGPPFGRVLDDLEPEGRSDQGLEELVAAYRRSRRVRGLDWASSVDRALAERLPDPVRLEVAFRFGAASRPQRRMHELVRIDGRAALGAACACLQEAFHLLPVTHEVPARRFVDACRAYVVGRGSREAVLRAGELLPDGAVSVDLYEPTPGHFTSAVVAIGQLKEAIFPFQSPIDLDWRLPRIPLLVAQARAEESADVEELDTVLAALAPVVDALLVARTQPVAGDVAAAPEAVRVAWDLVADDPETVHSVADLVRAHTRGAQLGLDWSDPTSRAVAERCADVALVGEILRGTARAP